MDSRIRIWVKLDPTNSAGRLLRRGQPRIGLSTVASILPNALSYLTNKMVAPGLLILRLCHPNPLVPVVRDVRVVWDAAGDQVG